MKIKPVMRKRTLGSALLAVWTLTVLPAQAAELTFSRIGSGGDQALQKVWGMTPDEIKRYKIFIEATGKRYENATPLMVLSIMADSQEDRIYYAKKAAEVEHNLVKREIEAAWYISEAMSEDRLADDMQRTTDGLTGIETLGYVPTHMRKAWQDDDEVVVVLDERCLSTGCITGIGRQIAATAPQAPRLFVIDTKQPLDEAARTLINSWTGKTEIRRLDPIEHAWLEKAERNYLLHVRNREVVDVLTGNNIPTTDEEIKALSPDATRETPAGTETAQPQQTVAKEAAGKGSKPATNAPATSAAGDGKQTAATATAKTAAPASAAAVPPSTATKPAANNPPASKTAAVPADGKTNKSGK
jgi:hypothetical protein